LFFRRSLRTRASLEIAIHQLGGQALNLTGMSDLWELENREGSIMDGRAPEHIKDAALVLSSYVDALAIRPELLGRSWDVDRNDDAIRSWARHSRVPVINMESALWHPLQALADLLTLQENLGSLRGRRLAIVWVHSPVAASAAAVHSLLHGALRKGLEVRLAHPVGYELDGAVLAEAEALAKGSGGRLETGLTLQAAAEGAEAVYARSWTSLASYGNPTLDANRRSRLADWRIDERLLERGASCKLMHAMPVRRNVEVTDEVLDGPRSLLYEQAANRLHSQKALLARLLGG
jgi:N-acetylornithine carbamoyltransferase